MAKTEAYRVDVTVLVPAGDKQDDVHEHMSRVCCEYTQGICEEGYHPIESYTENVPNKQMKGEMLKDAMEIIEFEKEDEDGKDS